MVAYQNQFRQAEDRIIAENRAREQQKIHDFETFRQRQREQKFWDERTAYGSESRPRRRHRRRNRAFSFQVAPPLIFVPDESQEDASREEPARCFSASVEDFLARILGYALTGTMWVYAALVVMPWLYASAFDRALVGLGVGFGLSVNLVVWVTCGIEFLVLCRVGKWIAKRIAACMAGLMVLPLAILEAGFDALFRRKTS